MQRSCLIGFAIVAVCILGGCASYRTPGSGADFRALGIAEEVAEQLTDVSIAQRLERKPLARFPTSIAVVRVQGSGYHSYTSRGYGYGKFTVVTERDVETDDAFKRLAALPMIDGIAPLNRLVMPERLDNEKDLRHAAASVQADMLLIYTFDTAFGTDKKIAPMGLITLGLFPDREARVTSTASAALLDTRNGYVYGLAEATGVQKRLTNAWNNQDAIDTSRRKAERDAFDGLVAQVEQMWRNVASRYGPPVTAASGESG